MSAPVIDLAEIRACRDAAVQAARGIAEDRVAYIVQAIKAHAHRAHVASAPLMASDPELARATHRWCARKLRSEVRRGLRHYMPPAGLADTVEIANDGFWAHLEGLYLADQVARIGGTAK